ncbi:hypothetical protein [Streptomyces sp. NPDC056660]|uniref:hypothetical protein n=1 Tax=Streptomyces sp. NPDC056660 TaxID=3345897 RepID=UPI003679ED31
MPLDPELPDGRLAFMLGDTGPGLVLTADAGSRRIPAGPWETVSVSDDARWAALPGTAPDVAASPPVPQSSNPAPLAPQTATADLMTVPVAMECPAF